MHCANLDALVKDMRSVHLSSPQATIPVTEESIAELPPQSDEDAEILKMVLDMGMFVLEGRLPHRKVKRGYIEGPHCVLQPSRAQSHQCDYSNYVCERAGKYGRLMEVIWNENNTLCIELRICADCSCGEEQVWKNSTSRYDYVLEQWIFEITNFRNSEDGIGVMNGYGLLQAIRSQIHFSQLSAWWSSNQAQLPKNITYHVIPLTQIDSNSCSLQHTFPALAFNSTYLQVKLRSQPRSETLPKIHCPVHCNQENVVVDDRMKIYCDRLGKHHCQALEDWERNVNDNTFCDGFLEAEALDGLIDEGARQKARSTKYGCSVAEDPSKLAPHEQRPSNEKRFSTFHKNSRYSGYPNAKHEGSSSSADATECLKTKIDSSSFGYRQLKEPPSSTYYKPKCSTLMEAEMRQLRARNTPSIRSSFDVESTPSRKKDKQMVETTAKTDCQCRPPTNVEDKGKMFGRDGQADLNVPRSDIPLTKVATAIGIGGDWFSETGLYCPRRGSFVKDSNNNTDMVEIRKLSVQGAKKNSKFSAKMIMPRNGHESKSADKSRTTVIKKYFRNKKVTAKPLLPLFGNVIESVLSGRMYFSQVVDNFKMKITSCVSFGTNSVGTELPAAAYYYHFGDVDLSRSYLVKSSIPDREKGIQISNAGQLQVSVFNTENSLIKVFIIPYDLSDMPRCTKTYIRHSNYYAPANITKYSIQWLQSLIQFKCVCSKSGRLYLQNDVNIIIFQKSDLNTACELQQRAELKHYNKTEIAYK